MTGAIRQGAESPVISPPFFVFFSRHSIHAQAETQCAGSRRPKMLCFATVSASSRQNSPPRLILLGTGHSEAVDFLNTNALLETSEGRLLIDCGYTIKRALRRHDLSLRDIDAVLVTHVHADHCFGLERMAIEHRYRFNTRPRLLVHADIVDELWDSTLKGVLGTSSDGGNHLGDFFDVTTLDESGFCFGGVEIRLYPTRHTPGKPCFGLLLNERIAYTSDTLPIPDILQALSPELIFHDVTLAEDNPVHPSLRLLKSGYSETLRKRMFLQSYEDDIEDFRDRIEADFRGVAREGQIINV